MTSPFRDPTFASRFLVWAAAALAAAWAVGIVAVPMLEASSGHGVATLGAWLRLTYAPVCHQMPERSLALAGHTLPVCSRCTGLYLGGLAGLIIAAPRRRRGWRAPHRLWLLAAVAPSVADFALGHLGGPALSNVPRLLVAFPAGAVAGLFLCEGVADLGRIVRQRLETGSGGDRWTSAHPTS